MAPLAELRIWRHVRRQLLRDTLRPRRPMSRRRRLRPRDCFPGVQYYFTGRYLQTTLGIENPTPAYNAIHDFSQQERASPTCRRFVDPTTRVSLIAGTSNNNFQIPNVPGATDLAERSRRTGIRRHQFRFSAAQRKSVGGHSLWRAVGADIRQRLRRPIVLFHPLQQSAFPAGPDRRSPAERHRLERHPHLLHQRHPGRRLVSGSIRPIRSALASRSAASRSFVGNTSLVEPCMVCDGTDNGAPDFDHRQRLENSAY